MHQDNDLKYSKSPTEWLKNKRMKVLQWSSQSPYLNLFEILLQGFKRAVHK